MIQEFVKRFDARRGEVQAAFQAKHPDNYGDVVKIVVNALRDNGRFDDSESPDPGRITEIDHGDYQGTLLYVVAAKGYQPDRYWYVKVAYGSCSSCDTLQGIRTGLFDDPPTDGEVEQYMALAVHVLQGLKKMADYGEEQ
jgi:hypothetical protein